MQQLRLITLLLILFTWSCKKEDTKEPNAPSTQGQKVKRTTGQPSGTAVRQTIGAGGGTIASADDRLHLTIPAGAVDGATEFTIQPVTNALESRGLAYRLLPEGISFKKDITLTYSYAGISLANPDSKYLLLVYQDADGYYHEAPRPQNDKTAQTLTVQTRHFSDWTFIGRVELKADQRLLEGKAFLKKSQSLKLEVHKYFTNTGMDASADGSWLLEDVFYEDIAQVNWTKTLAKGTLSPLTAKTMADYTAPSSIQLQEEFLITATVTDDNLGTDNLGQPIKQMILSQPVVLMPESDEFFELTVDGGLAQLHTLTAEFIPGWISIGGYLPNGHVLTIHAFGADTGNYAVGMAGMDGKSTFEYGIPGGVGFMGMRPERCDGGGGIVYSPGGINITKIAGAIGEYTEGTLSTTLFDIDWCGQGRTKTLTGRFMIRKNF